MAKKTTEVTSGAIGIQNIWGSPINVQCKPLGINEKLLVMEDQEVLNLIDNKYLKRVDPMEAGQEMAMRLEKEREAKNGHQ